MVAFLAMTGILFCWQHPLVKSLTFLTLLALLLALGKYFAPLYKLFFYYLPYFDKFRVPMMILTLVSFNLAVLAMFGLDYLLKGLPDTQQKSFYILAGAFGLIIASPLLFGGSLSLSSANEYAQYVNRFGEQQTRQLIELFRDARLDVLRTSTLRTLALFGLAAVLLLLMIRQPARKAYWGLGIILFIAFDLGSITVDYLDGKFVNIKRAEQQTYRLNEADRIILQDKSLHRVLPPLRDMARDSRWPYFHQSIGGYSAAKMQTIQDIITNNIINAANPRMPINLAVIGMLNGKYIVENQQLSHPDLTLLGSEQNLYVYRNERSLPRVFFVDSIRVIKNGNERLSALNEPSFAPSRVALLEETPSSPFSPPDSNSTARVIAYSPNELTIETSVSRPALLVVSEPFYPKGWQATLGNGERLPIYKTNHILRSVVVPAGKHTVTMEFQPSTYHQSVWISWLGWMVVYLGLAFLGFRLYQQRQSPGK